MKHDAGKHRPTLVLGGMSRALQAVIALGEHGARKYSDDSWLRVSNARQRYTDAMLRHTMAELAGETVDPDSGMPHAVHVAWNALVRLELMLREGVRDD